MEFTLERSLDVLRRTPESLRALLDGAGDFWTRRNYGPETFSPFDVVGHLLHAERTNWMVRLRTILERGEAVAFPAFDRYAMYEASEGRSLTELLDEFGAARSENLAALAALDLTPEQLERRGSHPQLGPVTVRQLIAAWTVHDLGHLHQVAKAMAFQYCDDVGPWREFLTILPRS